MVNCITAMREYRAPVAPLLYLQHPLVERLLAGEELVPEDKFAIPKYWNLQLGGEPLETALSDALISMYSFLPTTILDITPEGKIEPEGAFLYRLRSGAVQVNGVYQLNVERSTITMGFALPTKFWLSDISERFGL